MLRAELSVADIELACRFEPAYNVMRGTRGTLECRFERVSQLLVARVSATASPSALEYEGGWCVKQQCDRVAGLDVQRDTVVACVRLGRGDEPELHRKSFATTTVGVAQLTAWMADLEVIRVVMESTGVYWKCVYYPLEGLFSELWLVNAGHVKNVPGRKTDVADAEWLADVAAHGMVRPSFVPPPPVRELRELTRYRKTQIVVRAQEIQRLDKVLQDAGIKISSVASQSWAPRLGP